MWDDKRKVLSEKLLGSLCSMELVISKPKFQWCLCSLETRGPRELTAPSNATAGLVLWRIIWALALIPHYLKQHEWDLPPRHSHSFLLFSYPVTRTQAGNVISMVTGNQKNSFLTSIKFCRRNTHWDHRGQHSLMTWNAT